MIKGSFHEVKGIIKGEVDKGYDMSRSWEAEGKSEKKEWARLNTADRPH